jgi:CMP-N-acetylneuraminic acid synthetase
MSNDGIYEGMVRAVTVPRERSLDIDDELDLVIAEALLARRETGSVVP